MTKDDIVEKYDIHIESDGVATMSKQNLIKSINDSINIHTIKAPADKLLEILFCALNAKPIEGDD